MGIFQPRPPLSHPRASQGKKKSPGPDHKEERMTTATRSVFGEVLAELMEKRGIPGTEENISELAVAGGLDPERVLARVSQDTDEHVGNFRRVVENLGLTFEEMLEFVHAYTFEERRPPR